MVILSQELGSYDGERGDSFLNVDLLSRSHNLVRQGKLLDDQDLVTPIYIDVPIFPLLFLFDLPNMG